MAGVTSIEILGLPGVRAKLDRIFTAVENPDRSLLTEIGEYMRFRIQKRTAEGKDVDGKAFEPYSPAYAAYRDETGHPSGTVNLFFTGSMMSSMDFDIAAGKVEMFFQGTQDPSGVSNAAKAFWLNEKRTFFSLSEDDVQGITDIVNEYYNKVIRS